MRLQAQTLANSRLYHHLLQLTESSGAHEYPLQTSVMLDKINATFHSSGKNSIKSFFFFFREPDSLIDRQRAALVIIFLHFHEIVEGLYFHCSLSWVRHRSFLHTNVHISNSTEPTKFAFGTDIQQH